MLLERGAIMGTYGQGGVFRRGKVWWLYYSAHGTQHRESSDSEMKRDAVDLLKRRLTEVGAKPVDGRNPTFVLGAEAIRHDYRVNGRRSDIEKRIKNLVPVFGRLDLSTIGPVQIRSYQTVRLGDGAKPATVNRELACLRRMMTLLHEDGVLGAVPPIKKLDESDNIRTGFFEEDEFQALMAELPAHIQPVAEFGYITGWRVGELLSRDFADVGPNSVRIEGSATKNRVGREFPLIPRLRAVVDRQRLRSQGRLVRPLFFYDSGKRIKDFRGSWDRATQRAGLGHVLFHDLRRTAVRNMVQAGVDRTTAKALTGHKTDSVFERYDIVDTGRLERQASKLEQFYAEQPKRMVIYHNSNT